MTVVGDLVAPENLAHKLDRIATWLEIAEKQFGGLPEDASLKQAWEAMREAARALTAAPASVEDGECQKLEDESHFPQAEKHRRFLIRNGFATSSGFPPPPQEPSDERLRIVTAIEPFARLGGGFDMQAFHDLEDDVIIYSNSGKVITARDVRSIRELFVTLTDDGASCMHFRRAKGA